MKKAHHKKRVFVLLKNYVDLVGQAEMDLAAAGKTDIEDRLHSLSSIYYGTTWSLDYDVEKSLVRNAGFQVFLARRYTSSDDPRSSLRTGLFDQLKSHQDVEGVDMGHVLIGLDARMRYLSREVDFPKTKATGVELTTWVGDLGGAGARVALDRIKAPKTPATRYFIGNDYGASSNLEGDIGAYCVATGASSTLGEPAFPSSPTPIKDVLGQFFVSGTPRATPAQRAARCHKFVLLLGGTFKGKTLSNGAAIHATMADKLEAFGNRYLESFVGGQIPLPTPHVPTSVRDARNQAEAVEKAMQATKDRLSEATANLRKAAEDVADVFLHKLAANKL